MENDQISRVLDELQPGVKEPELHRQLVVLINEWLLHDFHRLVQLLYRVDVNEKELKSLLLAHPGTDAADLIAGLLIQRQLEKIRTRQSFKKDDSIPDDERW